MNRILVYLLIAVFLLILFFVSRKEELLSDQPVSTVIRPFRRASVWIYRKYWRRAHRKRGGKMLSPGKEKVRTDLKLLNPSGKQGRHVALYYVDKIQTFLLFFAAADFLAMAVCLSSGQEGRIQSGGVIERPGYTEKNIELEAVAQNVSGKGEGTESQKKPNTYTVRVSAQEYTEEQTKEMSEKLFAILPGKILADNASLSHVTGDLNLMTECEGYPFRIRWESSCYEYVDSDGDVETAMLSEGTSKEVELTAVLSYQDRRYEETIPIVIYPKSRTADEIFSDDVRVALNESDETTISENKFYLPDQVDGVFLLWSEEKEDNSLALFGVILAAGILVFFMSDRDLHHQTIQRERQMAQDYPKLISKMILLIGAGMSVRNAFERVGNDYKKTKEKGGEKRYAYEEILLMCREMESGILESAALEHFAIRCHSQRYSKFCALLDQNQKKGNSMLLQSLQEEADLANADRKNLAKQMGEEAGTKLLLPMIMMLVVTLVIILVPAYFSFSL